MLALHGEQLSEHGGRTGLHDGGLLESALARPRHLFHYGSPDLADLAAAYAFGLAKNHPFVDGKKRVSLVTTLTFLAINDVEVTVGDAELVVQWTAIADGSLDEGTAAAWLRSRISPVS